MKLLLVMFAGEAPRRVSVDRFEADNKEDEHLIAKVRALKVGETATFGGGAAPEVTVQVLN